MEKRFILVARWFGYRVNDGIGGTDAAGVQLSAAREFDLRKRTQPPLGCNTILCLRFGLGPDVFKNTRESLITKTVLDLAS